jgi:hypothetical protein
MNTKDIILIISLLAGWIVGVLAVLSVLAWRGRFHWWRTYWHRGLIGGFFIMPATHWLSWHGLLAVFPAYALIFTAFWLDLRKKFPTV